MFGDRDTDELSARLAVIEALFFGLVDALRRSDRKPGNVVDEAFAFAEDLLTAHALEAGSVREHAASMRTLRILEAHRLATYSD